MAVFRLYNDRHQFLANDGSPLTNGKLFLYLAGSSTKQASYNSILGTIPNSNPLILDGFGRLQSEVWLTAGTLYKAVLAESTDSDPPVAPYWTENNISGIGDSNITSSEWIEDATLIPTFISGSSFSVPGDKTSILTASRRLKILDSGGIKYGTIVSSAFTTLTTVVMAMESALVSPITSVSYSFADPVNPAISSDLIHRKAASITAAATTNIWGIAGDLVHITGNTGITSFGTAPYAGAIRQIIFDGTPVVTDGANLLCPNSKSFTASANMRAMVVADTLTSAIIFFLTPDVGLTLPRDYISGFTLTTASTTTYDIAAGQAADSTNTIDITGGALTAKSQATWAVGGTAGGKLSAAAMANNTWYYWFALLKDSDGTVDYGFDVATTPTLPTGYTKYRYIGARRTATGATTWETFIQHGDQVWWANPVQDVSSGTSPGTTAVTRTLSTPRVICEAILSARLTIGTTGSILYLSDLSVADNAASTTNYTLSAEGVASLAVGSQARIWTNSSAQIRSRVSFSDASVSYLINTLGWVDRRGKPV